MTILASRVQRLALERDNQRWPACLEEVSRELWPSMPPGCIRLWRSRRFLVQQYWFDDGRPSRLSISRTTLRKDGRWEDGITWDEVQKLKREAGFGHRYACELFPADADVVNVANVRHIWLLDEPPTYAWRDGANDQTCAAASVAEESTQ